MSLKPELKKIVAGVLSKNGMPPLIDKTFNSMWDTFAKTQPSPLSTTAKVDPDVWGSLTRNLEKFGIKPEYAKQVIMLVQKKFGETPSPTEIKAFMS